MDETPLLSVIVPVYKVEKYLDRCVRSILDQSYKNLEVILVDDGSPDSCGRLCDAWADRDARVRVLHQANGGAGQARNAALDFSHGELIGFVDGDDYISPGMYRRLYRLLMRENADIAECDYLETTSDNAPFSLEAGETVQVYTPREAMEAHIQDTAFRQIIWNKLYRRSTVESVRFPVGNLIDDEFWTYRALGNAKRLVRCADHLYAYRLSPGSAMRRSYSLKRTQGLDAKEQRLQYLRQRFPELGDRAQRELFLTCLYCMQGCHRYLRGQEAKAAREKITGLAQTLKPLPPDPAAGKKRVALMALAQMSLPATSRLLNFLEDIHVLTRAV